MFFVAVTSINQNKQRAMSNPVPGCVVLGVVGSVDSADIELQKKQRSECIYLHGYVILRKFLPRSGSFALALRH